MKLLITITFFFCATITWGQLSYDVNGGANIGNIVTKVNGERDKGLKPAIGYIIPLHVNFPVTKSLLLQTGVEFESIHHTINATRYGQNLAGETTMSKLTGKSHIEYINLTLKLYCKINAAIRIGIGPYFGIGISGRNKSTYTFQSVSGTSGIFFTNDNDSKTKFGSAYGEINRYNAGLGFSIAYVFSKNIIASYYSNLGLANMSHSENVNSKTIAMGLTIGYLFGKGAK